MDAPFDRGEVDRASLDATERLRARLSSQRTQPPRERPRSVLPWVIAGGLFVFSAGMIANPWFEANIRSHLPFAAPATNTAEVKALQDRLARIEAGAAPAAAMPAERLARTEAKVETSTDQIAHEADRIDKLAGEVAALRAHVDADHEQSAATIGAATAAADRAHAMLTLVLVRRAIDAGRPLGALDPALRHDFEARYPEAVKAITALGTAPASPASLRRSFDALRPALGAPAPGTVRQTWWDALTSTIAATVSRPAPGAAPAPAEAAATALDHGDIAGAAAQLRRLPTPRPPAITGWLADANRWQAGAMALATLETAVVLAPAPVVAAPASPAPASAAPAAAKTVPGRGATPPPQ